MLNSVKFLLRTKLSNNQKSILRFSYNIARDPKNIKRHFNRFTYDKRVLYTPSINYTPPVIVATIAENCNLRCPNCLYLIKDADKFHTSFIRPDDFARILEEYDRMHLAETIFLTGGEPLLHPEIDELIDICKEHNLSLNTSTNGILVRSRISSLSRFDYINVSVDSHDAESFKKYRGGTPKQFDLIKEGLRALKENGILFSISYILSKENLSEVDKMIEFAERIEPDSIGFHNINPHGCEQYKPLTLQDECTKIFLKKIIKRSDYPFDVLLPVIFDVNSPSFHEAQCIQPWFCFCFNSRGDISFCCHLAHDHKIGNVFADYDFNSPALINFRENIMEGKLTKDCLYCQRRFMGEEFGHFYSGMKKWILSDSTKLDHEPRL